MPKDQTALLRKTAVLPLLALKRDLPATQRVVEHRQETSAAPRTCQRASMPPPRLPLPLRSQAQQSSQHPLVNLPPLAPAIHATTSRSHLCSHPSSDLPTSIVP